MTSRIAALATLLAALAACGSSPTPAPEVEAPAKASPEGMGLSMEDILGSAQSDTLVPSPMETQRALESAEITTRLSTLVPAHTEARSSEDKDHVAVRTGVVLADMMLTVKTSDKDTLLSRLSVIRESMAALGGGRDIDLILGTTRDQIRGDSVTRDKLVADLDDLAGAVIPELEFNGQQRILPLIQAGTWLEGANLVAKAVKAEGKPAAADALLKQPAVVDYFIKYVRLEGAEHAPESVTQTLEASLTSLKAVASKSEPLTDEDVGLVIQVTDNVLALL